MKILLRLLFCLLLMAATLILSNCSPYGCNVTFGSSSCNPSGTGLGSGGTGGTGGGGGGGGGGSSSKPSAFAYAVDQAGTMDGYELSTSAGTLAPISGFTAPTISANTGGVGAVVAQGKFLYAVIEESQQIYGWQIGASGSLTALTGFPVSIPGLTGIIGTSYNQQVVITNPAGTLLFIDQFIPEQIFVYQISNTGGLTPASGSPFSTLGQTLEPQNMAMDGQGRFLYVSEDSGDHSGSFVVGYSVATGGQLTAIPNYTAWGNIPIWQMQGEPSGKYMIGITGETQSFFGSDDLHLHVYNIDQTSGALSEDTSAGSPFTTTYAPFNIAVQPVAGNTEYVYSFSVNDDYTGANPVEGFSLSTTTGALTELTGSPFGNLTSSAWGQFDPSGQFLFLYFSSGSVVNLTVLNVGTGGVLSSTVGSTPLQTSGYWAVSDVP